MTTADRQRNGVISAGTWALDRIKLIDGWPQEEHLAKITATDRQGGGSGYNLAIDLRKLDSSIPVEAIGLIANDADGEYLLQQAQAIGINTAQLHRTDKAGTSFTDVMSDTTNGKRTFFHFPGTSDLLCPDHFDFKSCNGRILHLGLLGLHKTMDSAWREYDNGWVAVLAAAKADGIATNLELVSIPEARIQSIATPCLAYLDTLIVNEYELGALAAAKVCDAQGVVQADLCLQAARTVLSMGTMSLVVVHHPGGAIAVTDDGDTRNVSSFEVDPGWIKSAVGAGDAFTAGMLYGMHQSWSLDNSLELAHAVAAASLRSSTTVGSVESAQACLAFARHASLPKTDQELV
ncbi:hypothetical protein AB833_22780 [Chromatiales bacterium (ex Bugula neritina AB1)]|nr:hypothetical protein AB833_22780 [Chromatiales bacterium (ex Bugula neritina AB1)]